MGVDLTLLPILGFYDGFHDNDDPHRQWVSLEVITLERRRNLWTAIDNLPQQAVPMPFSCYLGQQENGERGYGEIKEDPYGQPLKWITAKDLLRLKNRDEVTDNWQNRAIWAYLSEMPPNWPIVLYWS